VGIIGVVTSQISQNKQAENERIAHEALGSSIAIAAEQIGPAARVLTNLPTVEPTTWTALNNDNNNSFYRWWVSSSSNAILNSSNLPTGNWASVTFGNNIWVAINTAGTSFTSPDGVTWTQRNNLPNAGSLVYSNVIYGLGKFIATPSTAATNIATSVDGITWSSVTIASGVYTPACSTTTCIFLSTTSAAGYYTANLINFTTMPSVPFIAKDVVFSVTNFVMSGTNSIATSPTGATWTSRTISAHSWGLVGAINGTLVAVTTAAAGSTIIATSTNNGVTWVDSVLPKSGNWVAISTAGPQIALFSGAISGTNQSSYLASSDGISWVNNVLPAGAPWTGATSNNRSFLLYQSTNPSYLIPITSSVSANQQITVSTRVQQGRVSEENNGQYIASMTYNWNIAQKRWIPSKFVGSAALAASLGPDAPINVIGTRTAPGTIVVSWTPPVDTGSSAINSYLATSSPGGYYCGNGGQLDGTTCTLTTSTPATYNGSFYSCTSPDVLVGVTCRHTSTYAANYTPISYKCNTGDRPSGSQTSTYTCTR
ncbi:MAG: hypothetical protein K8R21_14440, partial [Leptospira sp.]|nr:hypothetical protein [Leptospira sp.]